MKIKTESVSIIIEKPTEAKDIVIVVEGLDYQLRFTKVTLGRQDWTSAVEQFRRVYEATGKQEEAVLEFVGSGFQQFCIRIAVDPRGRISGEINIKKGSYTQKEKLELIESWDGLYQSDLKPLLQNLIEMGTWTQEW